MGNLKFSKKPFEGTKRKRKSNKNKMESPRKKYLKKFNHKQSWFKSYEETTEERWNKESTLSSRKIVLPEEELECESSEDERAEEDVDENLTKPRRSIIFNMDLLQRAISENCVCKKCGGTQTLYEDTRMHHGLGSKLFFVCSSNCHPDGIYSTDKKDNSAFDINRRACVAMRSIGKGHSAAMKVFSIMDLGVPVSRGTWSKYTNELSEKVKIIAERNMTEAASDAYTGNLRNNDNSPVSIATSFDCSWNSRGWQAKQGVVAAISHDFGKVIDVVQKVSYCRECQKKQAERDQKIISTFEYMQWYVEHEINCTLNHTGSPQAMEKSAVVSLYERSVEKHNLCYDPFVGDGDSSAYREVNKMQVYGPTKLIGKEEDIGHCIKRAGSYMRSLVRDYKGKKLPDGKAISGKGRLTQNRIDALQSLFGHTLRKNKGNVDAMERGVRAILKHYSSSVEYPQHDECPKGENSWCKFQVDLATGGNSYVPVKDPIAPAIQKLLEPIFKKLSNRTFLESLKNIMTSNNNESYHHVLWSLAPKETFCSAKEVEVAMYLSTCLYNSGFGWTYKKLLDELGLFVSSDMINNFKKVDVTRIKNADYRSLDFVREKRKSTRRRKNKLADAFAKKDYSSGAFYATK